MPKGADQMQETGTSGTSSNSVTRATTAAAASEAAATRGTACCACECCSGGSESVAGPGQRVRVTLPIFGLGCGTEAPIVERALVKVPGVVHAYVNPATEMAYVDYHSCACNAEGLQDAVASVGLRAGVPGFR